MWQGPHGQNESAQRQRSEEGLTAFYIICPGISVKMLTFVFDKWKFSRIIMTRIIKKCWWLFPVLLCLLLGNDIPDYTNNPIKH